MLVFRQISRSFIYLTCLLPITQALVVSHANMSIAERGSNNLWDIDGAIGTMYYDLSGKDNCAKQFGTGWSESINTGIPRCGKLPLNDPLLNTNRIVALNWTVMSTDIMAFCGKEVEVYHKGKKFEFSEGPLVLWDTCERCMCEKTLDVSSLAYAELTGKPDCSAHLDDLRVVVTNNQIWAPDLDVADPLKPWSTSKKIAPIPLKVTNTAPVFPCRTAGNICNNAIRGMPIPDLRQVGEYCFESPIEGGEQILRKDLFAIQGVMPTGLIPTPPKVPPAVIPPPAATAKPASSGALPVALAVEVPVDPGLGVCTVYGQYGCVGQRPAVCDVSGTGTGYKWVATAPACHGKCVMLSSGANSCE